MFSKNPVTISLIAINTLVFAVIAWQQKSLTLGTHNDIVAILHAGANFNPLVMNGEYWRLISSMFLHFGFIHLAVNMYGLWQLGELLEPGIGSGRYAILYFICGLAAGLASLFFNVLVVSAGASGAIFGLYGFLLGAQLISFYKDRERLKQVLISFGIFVAINALIARGVNVDMAGHIGGAVAGLIIAFCHFKLRILKTYKEMIAVLILIPFVLLAVPRGQQRYYENFQRVIALEENANALLKSEMNETIVRDSLKQIHAEWKQIRKSLDEITHIPGDLHADLSSLQKFTDLLADQTAYQVHVLEETYVYRDSLEAFNEKFKTIPKLERTHIYKFIEPEEPADSTQQGSDSARSEIVRVTYDKDWKETSAENFTYYRLGTRDSAGRWQGPVRDYFRNGTVQMKGVYKDGLRHGIFLYYTDRNTYTSAGRYDKELAVGKWQTFHWNGTLSEEIFYDNVTRTISAWDSLGQQQVSGGNGNYKRWHANGALKEEGTFYSGVRTGFWLGYHEDGSPYYKEEFKVNRLLRGVSIDKNGKQYIYDGSSLIPTPAVGLKTYKQYLETNIKRPAGINDQGTVKVLFNVGADGSLWDFVILESVSPLCDKEAIRLVQEGPAWRPALLHGQEKVPSQGYVEVKF